MSWFLIALLLLALAACIVLGEVWRDRNGDRRLLLCGATFSMLVLALSIGTFLLSGYANGRSKIARRAELVQMLAGETGERALMEDVYGQVAALNQDLAKDRMWNSFSLLDPFFLDEWCAQQPIALPKNAGP